MSKLRTVRAFIATRWMTRFRSRDVLLRHQRRLLRKQLAFLERRSPYVRDAIARARASGSRRLDALPLMNKTAMMQRFDALNTVGVTRQDAMRVALEAERSRDFTPTLGGVTVGLSSGTSGHRGLFVVSANEQAAWAGTVLARFLPRGHIFGHRIAFFLRANSELYESVGSRAITFEYFDVFDPVTSHVDRLIALRPTIVVAPPSVLLALAETLPTGSLQPEEVICVAEVLTERDAQRIEHAFSQNMLHQAYQCTEGFLAHTCRLGELHLNEDIAFIEREYLSKDRFVPIVTDLRRRAQPIIRYRLNDVLVDAPACPCGSVLARVARIEGREDDVLRMPARDGGDDVAIFSDLVVRAMLYAEGFDEFRVVQAAPDALTVALDTESQGAQASVVRELRALTARLGALEPTIDFAPYIHEAGTKLRRVQRAVPEGEPYAETSDTSSEE